MAGVVQSIRTEYAAINAAIGSKKLRVVSKDLMGMSTEGGSMTNYYDGKDLRKTVIELFGEMGKGVTEYYFAHGELFFCFSSDTNYNKPFYMKGSHKKGVEENRWYFDHGKMIRWLNPAGKIVPASEYAKQTKDLLGLWKEADGHKEDD